MAIFGIVLLVVAGVLAVAVVTSNTGSTDIDLWGITVSNLSLGVVFLIGMVTTVVGVIGLVVTAGGLRRNRRLRKERRQLVQENKRLTQTDADLGTTAQDTDFDTTNRGDQR